MPDGAGFRLRTRVDDVEKSMTQQINGVAAETRLEIAAINKRGWYQAGGIGVVTALAVIVLGAWLAVKFKSAADSSVKREDVAAAIHQSATEAAAKTIDEVGLYKQMLDKAAVNIALPTVTPRTRK